MAGNAEQERIELLAAKQRLDHIYCGDPPPADDYWATLLYRGSPVEKYGYDDPVVSSVSQPFNGSSVGIAAHLSNAWGSASEIMRQQKPASSLPPSFAYEGPLGGAGFLGLFAPAPGSQKYKDFVAAQEAKEHYNPEKIGITPLPDNTRSTVVEIAKQTEGPNLWEKFSVAVKEGYASEPEEVNTFTKSIDQLRAASLGIVKPSNITLLVVGGLVLLVLLLK